MFDIATSRRALPGQLFNSTRFPGRLWLLAKNRSVDGKRGVSDHRKRILFICRTSAPALD